MLGGASEIGLALGSEVLGGEVRVAESTDDVLMRLEDALSEDDLLAFRLLVGSSGGGKLSVVEAGL